MTARDKFSKGRRVKLSAKGLEWARKNYKRLNATTRATVTGYGRDPKMLKIQRDDIRTIMSAHMDHWEPAPEQLPLLPLDVENDQKPRIFTSLEPIANPLTGQHDGRAHSVILQRDDQVIGGGVQISLKGLRVVRPDET